MAAVGRFFGKIFEELSKEGGFSLVRSKVEIFRDMLAANFKAMELITDTGEKLGGEYIFDMQYLRTLDRNLEDCLQNTP